MTDEEKKFFEALSIRRAALADHFDDPAARKGWLSIVERYSDQAHFIYELLQNADDAGATRARFYLKPDELLFVHNGTRHFSITAPDPESEERDALNKTLGDVNAITSVGSSNKTDNAIGKFGVGFKAVFHYTATPHIYDPAFAFKIERYIVPSVLDGDHPVRRGEETLFAFPFDRRDLKPQRAEREIADKLAKLIQPTLFLNNLTEVSYEHGSSSGGYRKDILETHDFDDIRAELIRLVQINNGTAQLQKPAQTFWLFTRSVRIVNDQIDISVGYLLDRDRIAPALLYNAFCFFPTKEKTGLNFIVQAPFLLTESRENIRAADFRNIAMIKKLAELAADALEILSNFGKLDDGILNVIPFDRTVFGEASDKDQISFRPFYDDIKAKFKCAAIIPVGDGKCVESSNAYWSRTTVLNQLFDDERLKLLTDNPNAAWAFRSISEKHVGGAALNRYIREVVADSFEDENLLPNLKEEFIEKQPIEWLRKLYRYLTETELRMKLTRFLPIFLDQKRWARSAFSPDGRETLFLPTEGEADFPTINRELVKDADIRRSLLKFGFKEPELEDEIYTKILPRYSSGAEFDTRAHIKKFVQWYREAPTDKRSKLVGALKTCRYVFARAEDGRARRFYPHEMYLYSEQLKDYFDGVKAVKFVQLEDYEPANKRELNALKDLLIATGVASELPRLVTHELMLSEAIRFKLPRYNQKRDAVWRETRIDGCQEILHWIERTQDKYKSIILWRVLLKMFEQRFVKRQTPEKELIGHVRFTDSDRRREYTSTDIMALRQTPWLFDNQGQFKAPSELEKAALSTEYDRQSGEAERLSKFLKIGDDANLTPEQLRKIRIANLLEQHGITEEILLDIIKSIQEGE